MIITTTQLENVKEVQTITAVSTFGTGFLTYIVSSFIELLGIENNMLANKIDKAKDSALNKMISQANRMRGVKGIMNVRFEISNRTVFVYGTAYKDELPEL